MKILIVAAMDVEVEHLCNFMKKNNIETKRIGIFDFYFSKIKQNEIIVSKSGIGKVAAATLITTALNNIPNIDRVINVGIAGGIEGDVNLFDIVLGTGFIYGDVDLTIPNDETCSYGQMADCPRVFNSDDKLLSLSCCDVAIKGVICTSDKFMRCQREIKRLLSKSLSGLNIKAFEMESTAFAQVCNYYNVPFSAIRVISDLIGTTNKDTSYINNFEKAANISNDFILKVLEEI